MKWKSRKNNANKGSVSYTVLSIIIYLIGFLYKINILHMIHELKSNSCPSSHNFFPSPIFCFKKYKYLKPSKFIDFIYCPWQIHLGCLLPKWLLLLLGWPSFPMAMSEFCLPRVFGKGSSAGAPLSHGGRWMDDLLFFANLTSLFITL